MGVVQTTSSTRARIRGVRLTDSGVWTVPATCEAAELIIIGGGAGGGGGGGGAVNNVAGAPTSFALGGGGGGAGGASAYARFLRIVLVPGEQIVYSVGAGGVGGAGANGGAVPIGQTTVVVGYVSGANTGAKGAPGSPTTFGTYIAHGAEGTYSNTSYGPGGFGGSGGQATTTSNVTSPGGYSGTGGATPTEVVDTLYNTSNSGGNASAVGNAIYSGVAFGGNGGGGVNSSLGGSAGQYATARPVLPNTWYQGTSNYIFDAVSMENITRAYTLAGGGGGGGAAGFGFGTDSQSTTLHRAYLNTQPAAAGGSPYQGGTGGALGYNQAVTEIAGTGATWPLGITGRPGGNATAPGGGGGGGNGGAAVRGNGTTVCPVANGGAGGNGGNGIILIRWEEV